MYSFAFSFAVISIFVLAANALRMPVSRNAFTASRTSFKLNMGVKLMCDDNEPIEKTLKLFKRSVNQSGHLMDLRYKEQWETAAERKKRKHERARLLNRIERTNDMYERKYEGVSEYRS